MVKETGLQIFENEKFGNVRVVMRDDEPWFVAADVCKAFGDTNHNRSVGRIDDIDKAMVDIIDSMGRSQNAIVINESGLYALLFAMQPQKANSNGVSNAYPIETQKRIEDLHKFKRWITHDVIPSIRKNGGYVDEIGKFVSSYFPQADEPTRMFIAQSLEENKRQQAIIKKQSEQIEEQKPQVEFAEHIMKSSDNIKMRDMAKLLCDENINIGEKRLYNLLRDKKVLMIDKSPYQSFVDRGYFYVSENSYTTVYGTTGISSTTLVTPKGQIWLVGKVREWTKIA